MRPCQSGHPTGPVFAGAAGDAAAGAEADALGAGAAGAVRFTGAADGDDVAAGRAVFTGGAEGAAPLELPPGRNANIRNKVIAKPVCSSGASDKSGRLVMVI